MSEVVVKDAPGQPAPRAGHGPFRMGWIGLGVVVIAAGLAGLYLWSRSHGGAHARAGAPETEHAGSSSESHDGSGSGSVVRVEAVNPRRGGLGRTTVQPGSVHAFEFAELYAKVSGYLKSQTVDIGDRVKKGDQLAEIDVPELHKSVDQARASVADAKAREDQAVARVKSAQATVKAANAALAQRRVEVEKYVSARKYRQKERDRIVDLARRSAIEERLVDEQLDRYESALAAEHEARAGVLSAEAEVGEAEAKLETARADLEEARASVKIAEADLAKAEVMVDYTRIISPYDGVITLRNFHPGDFIRSSADNQTLPLLAVARTDKMRVVVRIPDRDVPFLDRGDPAIVRVDALGSREFKGPIARYADAEDPQDRTMRSEVDLPNPDGKLRQGMYGGVTVILEPPSKNLTVPSSALIEVEGDGRGTVYVIRDGKAHLVTVRVGRDTGIDAEILEGLSPDDQVIVRYNGSLAEGVAVEAEPAATAPAPSEEAGKGKEAAQGAQETTASGAVKTSEEVPVTTAPVAPPAPREREKATPKGTAER
jgi:RND family efflux transporter MFP subunit